MSPQQLEQMQQEINEMHGTRPSIPDVRQDSNGLATWYEHTSTGTKTWPLKAKQYDTYTCLQRAGEKQIKLFLSGEGGTFYFVDWRVYDNVVMS